MEVSVILPVQSPTEPFAKIPLVVILVSVPLVTLLTLIKCAKISTNVQLVPLDVLKVVPICQVLSNAVAAMDTPTMLILTHATTLMSAMLPFVIVMHNVLLTSVESETDVTT